jgi:hypothetical protein
VLQRQGPDVALHRFGYSVAISDNAEWVVVSNPADDPSLPVPVKGAAIFQRSAAGVYGLQRPLLTPPETTSTASFPFVALSGDGRTLSMTSTSQAVFYDRDAAGLWVRVPGAIAATTTMTLNASIGPGIRPVQINTDGTTAVVCSDGDVSIYTRPAGSPAGTAFTAGPSFLRPAGDTGYSTISLSADGAMCAVLLRTASGPTRVQVFRLSGGAGGVWGLAESIPLTFSIFGGNRGLAMSADGQTIMIRTVGAVYWLRRTAGTWFQMNTTGFNLAGFGNEAIGLGPDGQWAYYGTSSGARIIRPQANNSWADTGGVPPQIPYPDLTYSSLNGQAIDVTPDGRFAVAGYPTFSRIDGNGDVIESSIGFAHLLDLRPPATVALQPSGQAVAVGNSASFTFTVTSEVPPQYQWRRNGVNIADGPSAGGGSYSGTQSPMLTVSNVQAADQFSIFDCVVVNACSNLTSNPAVLSVQTGGTGGQCLADLGATGGVPGQDGFLDNNDFIVFIDYFFNQTGCP